MVEEGDDVEAAELVLSSLDSEKAAASQTANEEEGSKKVWGYINTCVCVCVCVCACVIYSLYISYIKIHIYLFI